METLFEQFWEVYPRKDAKKAARKAWDKLEPDLLLLERIKIYIKMKLAAGGWNDRAFIPHPATFLNGERWTDEIIQKATSTRDLTLEQELNDRSWAN